MPLGKHHCIRIRFSYRMELLQKDIDICDATIRHLTSCKDCNDDTFCPVGDKLYKDFLVAQGRAKLLRGDEDVPAQE